jgi:hypothetical protein
LNVSGCAARTANPGFQHDRKFVLDFADFRRIVRGHRSTRLGTQFSKGPIMLPVNPANSKPGLPMHGAVGAWAHGCRFDRRHGDFIG